MEENIVTTGVGTAACGGTTFLGTTRFRGTHQTNDGQIYRVPGNGKGVTFGGGRIVLLGKAESREDLRKFLRTGALEFIELDTLGIVIVAHKIIAVVLAQQSGFVG